MATWGTEPMVLAPVIFPLPVRMIDGAIASPLIVLEPLMDIFTQENTFAVNIFDPLITNWPLAWVDIPLALHEPLPLQVISFPVTIA